MYGYPGRRKIASAVADKEASDLADHPLGTRSRTRQWCSNTPHITTVG